MMEWKAFVIEENRNRGGIYMKKEAVNQQSIYVHIDHVINNVATSGISFCDFLNGVGQPLKIFC